jgi:hypothetical protein
MITHNEIKVRKFTRTGHYYVEINGWGYEMSDNANMPNGVCITLSDGYEVDYPSEDEFVSEIISEIPIGVAKQIANIVLFQATIDE